jgi:N-acetylmuramoyl-L-alanine amidase
MRPLVALLALALVASSALANPSGPPRRRAVDAVVIHSLGGPDCLNGTVFHRQIEGTAAEWAAFFTRLPGVSIHYVIDRAGALATSLPEDQVASHAIGWNQRSISIELVNNGDGKDPFPDAQMTALLRLVREIRQRHPAVRVENFRRHSDVDVSTFPERRHGIACTKFRRKLDPGDAFPWEEFLAAARAGRTTWPWKTANRQHRPTVLAHRRSQRVRARVRVSPDA